MVRTGAQPSRLINAFKEKFINLDLPACLDYRCNYGSLSVRREIQFQHTLEHVISFTRNEVLSGLKLNFSIGNMRAINNFIYRQKAVREKLFRRQTKRRGPPNQFLRAITSF